MESSPQEIFHLAIGQAGIQIARVFWDIACREHGINKSGHMTKGITSKGHQILFQESSLGLYFPRTLMVDAEPTVMDCILTGEYKNLFDEQDFISGNESSANNYAIGRNTTWKGIYEDFDDAFSKKYEACDHLNTMITMNSISGGTGSGTGSSIMFALDAVLRKVSRISAVVYPCQVFSTSTVDQYNAALALKDESAKVDFNLVYDNLGLYRLFNEAQSEAPNYWNLNDLIAQNISDVTCGDRFHGHVGSSVDQLKTNLCPFPLLKYILPGMTPLKTKLKSSPKCKRVTFDIMKSNSSLNAYNHTHGINTAVALLYRGKVSPREAADTIAKARYHLEFFDWSGTGVKFGICPKIQEKSSYTILKRSEVSCSRLSNNTIIQKCFESMQTKFSKLLRLHSFVHWYTKEPGFEMSEFNDTIDYLSQLQGTYKELSLWRLDE